MNLKSILVVACLVVGGAAIAQTGGKTTGKNTGQNTGRQGGPQGGQNRRFQMRTPEQRVERLSTELKLNADQKKKIIALYKSTDPKSKAIMENQKTSREQKMAAFRSLREETNKKMAAILTKDQMKKLQAMRQRGGMRPGGPGAGGGNAGSKTGASKAGSSKSGGTKSGGKG